MTFKIFSDDICALSTWHLYSLQNGFENMYIYKGIMVINSETSDSILTAESIANKLYKLIWKQKHVWRSDGKYFW